MGLLDFLPRRHPSENQELSIPLVVWRGTEFFLALGDLATLLSCLRISLGWALMLFRVMTPRVQAYKRMIKWILGVYQSYTKLLIKWALLTNYYDVSSVDLLAISVWFLSSASSSCLLTSISYLKTRSDFDAAFSASLRFMFFSLTESTIPLWVTS